MSYFKYIFIGIILMSFWSCKNDVTKSFESKPMALARMNEIIALADEDLWDSPVKDTFNYYFQSAYPIMPAPEPMFDVRYFSPKELGYEPLRKELRTYIVLADLTDLEATTTKMLRRDLGEERFLKAKEDPTFQSSVGKDKWARGQIIVYLFANGKKALMETIRNNYSAIAKRIRLHDKDQLDASIYVLKNPSPGISKKIQNKFGVTIKIPGDYISLKEDVDNFMWFKKDTKEAAMNIIIQKFPYTSTSQLDPANIIQKRDEYGKTHIASGAEGSYMVTNTVDLPTYDYTYEIDGQYTKEVRGIWEMENDFMGGPYATYMVHNKVANELIFIDTFVYAPGKNKRDMMLQLDYIIKTLEIAPAIESLN
ncbi:MAG: DUF4837 family protein [Saprospiraceae bacterium]|nr:DUF4837 family protein [Saprospiraceae bacterium]